MFLYHGKTFESALGGKCVVGVVCDQCGGTYYYELARIGSGARTAPYGIGSSSASQKAEVQSQTDLARRLASEAELVPCPRCNWISDELLRGYRLARYRSVGKLAFALGLAGSILSLIIAWFIHLRSPLDRWLLPYFLIGGPATSAGMAMTLLLLRRWLRSRIQPNRDFPQEPTLPSGTPPALVMDEATRDLRPAKLASTPADGCLDFQFARHLLPNLCSECLQTSSTDHVYPIRVTRLIQFVIPRCAECARKAARKSRGISLTVLILGLLTGGAMVLGMAGASVELWIIIDSSLLLIVLLLVLAAMVVAARTAPAKVVGRDRSRGVVRLRFRNPDYVKVVTHSLNAMAREN